MPLPDRFKKLDVRPFLERDEEPLPKIRKAVDGLHAGEGLIIIAPFIPAPLIEKLGSEGFKSRLEHGADGSWHAYFWRETD